ncbi:glycosyltransferase [Candidatus Planktophila dulcis]|nr:glycosyltransferase [Candidatus Planktophila dulcis]
MLLVSGIYPPDTGGPATFTQDFSRWLLQKNLDVSIITYTDESSTTSIVDGVRIFQIHRDKNIVKRYFNFISVLVKNYNSSTKVLAAGAFLEIMTASMIRNIKYMIKIPGDIVWERARNSGITDLDINSFQNSELNSKYKVFRRLFIFSISRAKNVVVPSAFLQSMAVNWVGDSKRIELVYNSIDHSRFSHTESAKRNFDVVTASRLVPWKGVDELIQCCTELNLSLGIAGVGPDEARLKDLALDLGSSVTFLGQIPKSEMPAFYSAGEYFVLNSSYEGLPHALVEAKASGLLCIGRAGTGSEEVVRNLVDGMLVSNEPGNSLKETLERAISDPELVARLRLNAHEDVVDRFSQDINFQKIYDVLIRR